MLETCFYFVSLLRLPCQDSLPTPFFPEKKINLNQQYSPTSQNLPKKPFPIQGTTLPTQWSLPTQEPLPQLENSPHPRTFSLPMNPLASKDTLPTQEPPAHPRTFFLHKNPLLTQKPPFTHWQEPPSYPRSHSSLKNLMPTLPLSIPKPSPHQEPLAYLKTLSLPMLPSQSAKMRRSSK